MNGMYAHSQHAGAGPSGPPQSFPPRPPVEILAITSATSFGQGTGSPHVDSDAATGIQRAPATGQFRYHVAVKLAIDANSCP